MGNNIEEKVIVITGASSGLGEATARHLSARGARVVLGARRVDRLTSLADELTGHGGKALAIATDVTHCDTRRIVRAGSRLRHEPAGGGGHQRDTVPAHSSGAIASEDPHR